jgi:type IV fimbrial biogenesis protein FimT
LLGYQEGRRVLNPHPAQHGFTLIELAVGMVITGILLASAAPSFRDWIQSSQIRTAAESIQNGLQLARTEAVRRNTTVRFNLSNATGLVDWDVCATPTSPCPAANTIQSRSNADGTVNARVGVNDDNDGPPPYNYAAALPAGGELPAHITFNGLGRAVKTPAGDDYLTRIDVTNAVAPNARRLVIVISSPGGQIRMCDPARASTDPQGC